MFQELRDVLNGDYKRRARIHTTIGVASGLTAGLLIGGITGVLLAPKSGKETREDLRKGMKTSEENVKEAAENIKKATRQKVSEVKKFIRKADKKVESIIDDVAEGI